MLTVHLLGHVHVTQDGKLVVLSAKALALLVYLAAERVPQHRERLADLLWNSPEARTNLRVELARIRAAGLDIFPPSRQMLSLEHVETDIDQWMRQSGDMDQTELAAWLATLRGLPLCGLEDLGSSGFQMWVEQQRWVYCERVEAMLAQTYARYATAGQTWATRLIAARAETIGFASVAEMDGTDEEPGTGGSPGSAAGTLPDRQADHVAHSSALGGGQEGAHVALLESPASLVADLLPPSSVAGRVPLFGTWDWETQPPTFARPTEEQVLAQVCERATAQPQLLMLSGPPGIGKSYLATTLSRRLAWESLRLTAGSSGRVMLAALAQGLLRLTDIEGAQTLWQVLLQPASLDEDMVKVAVILARLPRPLLLIVEEADAAGADLATLFECSLQMGNEGPRLFLLLSREHSERLPYFRRLLRRSGAVQALAVQPLTFASMEAALGPAFWQRPGLSDAESRHIHQVASQLFQRSEGNPLHLRGLIQALQAADPDSGNDFASAMLPPSVRSTLLSEAEDWPENIRDAMSRLSAINGSFDRQTALVVLALDSEERADTVLQGALERQILIEVETGLALRVSDFTPIRIAPDNEVQYMFRNEALRVVLAGQLPQRIRQDVRRRLVGWVSASEPGLASYYAERAGLTEQATQLWERYQAQLPAGSPLIVGDAPPEAPDMAPVPEPPRLLPRVAGQGGRWLHEYRASGYTVSLDGGWLNVMSDGRYGHPQTLHLRFEWPEALSGDLDLTWRLDVFGGGEELRPSQTPFPLRIKPLRPTERAERTGRLPGGHQGGPDWEQGEVYLFSPRVHGDFREGALTYSAQPGVVTGQWMTHRLPGLQGVTGLHLSVRALDVSLSIGQLVVAGRRLLPIDPGGRAALTTLDSIGSGQESATR